MASSLRSVLGDEEKTKLFQLLFVMDDNDESIEVVEASEIDVEQLEAHLNLGGSVYIRKKTLL